MIGNLRDLGGIQAADGRRVKPRLFVRSATLNHASEDDLAMLAQEYGVRRNYDLRTTREVLHHPDPCHPQIEYIEFPLAAETSVGLSLSSAISLTERMAAAPDKETMYAMVPDMADVYVKMLREDYSFTQFRTLIRELLDPAHLADGASLCHCTQGKDRTGMSAAAVLLVLGASREDILADYMASRDFVTPNADHYYEKCLDLFQDEHAAWLIRELCLVKERYLGAFLDEIDAQFGGKKGFIHDYLGIDDTYLRAIRDAALA